MRFQFLALLFVCILCIKMSAFLNDAAFLLFISMKVFVNFEVHPIKESWNCLWVEIFQLLLYVDLKQVCCCCNLFMKLFVIVVDCWSAVV